MVLAVVATGVLLLVVAYLMTNPAKARPFASGVSADPSRLRSDVESHLHRERLSGLDQLTAEYDFVANYSDNPFHHLLPPGKSTYNDNRCHNTWNDKKFLHRSLCSFTTP